MVNANRTAVNAIMKWPTAIRAPSRTCDAAEHAVGENAADDRREVYEPGIETVICDENGCTSSRPEHRFERMLERPSPITFRRGRDAAGFDQVEDEQRAHAIVGKRSHISGREQVAPAARMANRSLARPHRGALGG